VVLRRKILTNLCHENSTWRWLIVDIQAISISAKSGHNEIARKQAVHEPRQIQINGEIGLVITKKPKHNLGVVKNLIEHPLPCDQAAPVRRVLAHMPTSIILDQYGCIASCGQEIAALAGVARQTLYGQPIKSLLPALPFQLGTPGYNIAFAVFQANTRRRTVCEMKKGADVRVTVDVSLTVFETAPAYLFSLEIRQHASLAVLTPDVIAPGHQQALFQRCA
jgi:hypothetical protein